MCRDADGGRDDDEIFNDVLAFERGNEERLPRHLREEEERKHGHEHMKCKEGNDHPCCLGDEEENADEAFEKSEEKIERGKCYRCGKCSNGVMKERFYERACRA